MKLKLIAAAIGLATVLGASTANAVPMSFSAALTHNNNVHTPNVLNFNFMGLPTANILTTPTLRFDAIADLNGTTEFLAVDLDGGAMTNVFVIGGLQQQAVNTTININVNDLLDGTFNVTVTPSTAVNNLGPNTLTLTLAYRHDPMGVPEPGTLALFGLGLAGLGLARRRKAA